MSNTESIQVDLLDPSRITTNRAGRQRREIDLNKNGTLESIRQHGVLQPIVVRRFAPLESTSIAPLLTLVIGERRLECCRQLGIPVPAIYFDQLDPLAAAIVEFDENSKRSDLPWRDYALAVEHIDSIHRERDPTWTNLKTASILSFDPTWCGKVLAVARALKNNNDRIADCGGIESAHSVLVRIADRRAAQIVQELIGEEEKSDDLGNIFRPSSVDSDVPAGPTPNEVLGPGEIGGEGTPSGIFNHSRGIVVNPILVADFLTWAPAYTGPKFNVIHVDFPYGEAIGPGMRAEPGTYENTRDLFWALTDCFCANFDRFVSYSAHVIFWFSMKNYCELYQRLSALDLFMTEHPLVWLQPNSSTPPPVIGMQPVRAYETALLCSRGRRPLVRARLNGYQAGRVSKPIHPTQKNEAMLRYFLSMVVDSTTDFFDPTAGSGSSLRAAEDLGAASILGLELNPEYAAIANAETTRARELRLLNKRAFPDEEESPFG